MNLFNSLIIAFSTYSQIPMPQVQWNERNMKYSICFFPAIGIAIGAIFLLWLYICQFLHIGSMLKGVVAALLPVLISGGIHMDGLCDTADALASHQSQEKKLLILKDSHCGAFAIIACVCYLLLACAVFSEIQNMQQGIIIALIFILSRSISGFALVTLKHNPASSLLKAFAESAHKKMVRTIMLLYIIPISCALLYINIVYGIAVLVACAATFFYYRHMAYQQFSGITGDLAGFFLQLTELIAPFTIIIIGRIV